MTAPARLPSEVRIVEVGPRDGLQNEDAVVPAAAKVAFVDALADAGLSVVEVTSFVSPRAVPQLADADEVLPRVRRRPGVRYPVLVPNMRGMERAERAGADAVAVFTAASEAFNQRNIGMSIAESLSTFEPVLDRARELGWWRRGYVSTAFGCPYAGAVDTTRVVEVCLALLDLGCDEISVGDTIGVAEPDDVRRVCDALGRSTTCRPAWSAASGSTTRRPAAPGDARSHPGLRATSRPSRCATCSTSSASSTGSTHRGLGPPRKRCGPA
jgi:isopropylmalate/homocitrate/citramalate synthase